MDRPSFIKNCEELRSFETFSYPGDRSSWPHAHKEEEEFILILEGTPQIWIDGNIYDLNPGDCVGLASGTGHAHTLINNSDKEIKAIVIGEVDVPADKIFYPKHPDRNAECKEANFYWEAHPKNKMGPHDGRPDKKGPVIL